jgi:hypothetical protein
MAIPKSQYLKAVQAIHQQVAVPENHPALPALPHGLWQAVAQSARGIIKAQVRGSFSNCSAQ